MSQPILLKATMLTFHSARPELATRVNHREETKILLFDPYITKPHPRSSCRGRDLLP